VIAITMPPERGMVPPVADSQPDPAASFIDDYLSINKKLFTCD
jgi:hypothetical protein